MYDIVFKDATTVVAGREVRADLAVRSGLIERIDGSIGSAAAAEVTCGGLVLLPGAIDLHVHLREPGMTHKETIATGTAAAVRAGVTTVLDMPNTIPPTTTVAALDGKFAIAEATARCRCGFYMALTADNIDEVERAAARPGFAGVKVFLGSTTGELLLTDFDAFEEALARVDALFAVHAESESVLIGPRSWFGGMRSPCFHHLARPVSAVVDGVSRVIGLAGAGRRLHICHLSSAAEVDLVNEARDARGITCEVTPHHLLLTCWQTGRLWNRLKVNPPVRDDRTTLLPALVVGVIDAVASDHAPHTADEKSMPYGEAPSGVPGLDTMVPAVLRLVQVGVLTLPKAVEVLSTNPARIAGLGDRGRITEGRVADLFLWDPAATWKVTAADLLTKCGWSPFEGMTLAARPSRVWMGGEEVKAR